jgi:hypothetical protein
MTWNWESTWSACVFVGRQLGSGTPCPSHAGRWSADTSGAVHGQPSAYAAPCPTADLPWPFTPREYARLLLVRSRACEVRPLRTLGLTHPESGPWRCLHWLRPFVVLVIGLRNEPVEELMNDRTAAAESDPARAWRIEQVRAQVRLLETLHAHRLRHTVSDGAGS